MSKQTALYEEHLRSGGKLVDFAGWQLPVNYGSQIREHEAVRAHAGMFDVSHMTIVDVDGDGAAAFLRYLVANDVDKLSSGQALYGALLNESGGVIDDLIVYRRNAGYRCVTNAATRDKVLTHYARYCSGAVVWSEQDLSMIAVQGPQARSLFVAHAGAALNVDLARVLDLSPFSAYEVGQCMVGITGYTGEDGVEVMLPHAQASTVWRALLQAGVVPAGLGARDTLRLEAGLNLYGQDLDEDHSPLESNISWTIAWQPEDRDFVGRQMLTAQRERVASKLVGIVLQDKGVLRHGQTVITNAGPGQVTSGTFSPTMQCSIGLARVPKAADSCTVDIRGKQKSAKMVQPPFVRNGKIRITAD